MMYPSIQFKTTRPLARNLIERSRGRCRFVFVALALAGFALLPSLRAVIPAPDGGYAGQNTAEGTDALFHLTIGMRNTAIGFNALWSNANGGSNTAIGDNALWSNTSGSGNTATGDSALWGNLMGTFNTATGNEVLFNN